MTKTKTVKPGRPKSAEKRNQIMLAASELFLAQGYTNTSMDLVAKEAGVSKQTVYSHFANKAALFTAVIDWKCEQYPFVANTDLFSHSDLATKLSHLGRQYLHLMQDEQVSAMYTVVIGEGRKNPGVAELFYEAGPRRAIGVVARILMQHQHVELTQHQAVEHSVDFFNLLKGEFHMRNILGLQPNLSDEQIERSVKQAVKKMVVLVQACCD